MRTRNAPQLAKHTNSLILIGVFVIVAAVVALPMYSVRSSSLPAAHPDVAGVPSRTTAKVSNLSSLTASSSQGLTPWGTLFGSLVPVPQLLPEGIATYLASGCATPKSDFVLGEQVCAKATGVPVSLFPWKISWVDPTGLVRQSVVASTNEATTYTYTPDMRGSWRVNLTRPNGAVRQTATFTVHDTANVAADVYVQKFNRDPDQLVTAGGSVAFILLVGNDGPDPAQAVHLLDALPSGSTLASFSQQSGPSCLPNGTGDCTIATLNSGQRAEFTVVYNTGTSAPGTYTTSASVSSTTTDPDTSDNSSTATFEISAGGGGAQCTLSCPTSPAAVNNQPGQNGATVDWDGPNNDNVPVATGSTCGAVSVSTTSPHFFSIGSTPITVTTESGEECTFTVTVIDTENPVIGNCPANITVSENPGTPGSAIVEYATPTATDNGGEASVTCDQPSGESFMVAGSPHTVTCTATDNSGNTDTCTFTVTVTSNAGDCTLTPPANITTTNDANQCGAIVTYQDPTQSGTSCGTVSCDRPSGSFFPVGTTVVSCRDTSGATTQFNVTVNDTTAPAPNVPNLPTINRGCAVTLDVPSATDNCGGQIGGSTNDPRTYDQPGTYTVHWTYTDASGNSSSQDQTVVISADTIPPVPDVATLPNVTGECSATVTTVPTATDDCSGGNIEGTTSDPLTFTGAGTYTVHWIYTDAAGNSSSQNQTVVVTDTHPPTIALVGASSITVECHTSFDDPDVTTDDNCVPKNVTVTRTGAFDINTPNTYTLTYTAKDGGGNEASVQRTVIVQDTIKPVITLNGAASMTVECHTSFTDPGATATDTCDTSVPVTVSGSVNVNVPGTYTLTYNAVDDSGNPATSVQRTVTVVDTTAPTINCPASITVYLPLNTTATSTVVNYTAPVGTDSCGTATTTQTAGLPGGASFPVGTTTNTFTVTDGANLSTSCSFTVTVLYNFTGFFSPVSNPPSVNNVNAGRSIPLKFSLSGYKGLDIFAAGYPASQQVVCDSSAPLSELEGTETPGGSTLTYSPDQYHYNWKTEKSWAGTCRQLVVKLNDGSILIANFKFK